MSNFIEMDKYHDMQKFINASSEYLLHHCESYASDIQRHLQIIASATSVEAFDPASPIVAQFYASLHELMSALDSRSMLVWSAISVLQKACSNPSAKSTLVHTYKFVPVLTKFLNVDQVGDKQLRLFHVMKELTYGVKIEWEEAHLPYLISTLVQIILEGNNELKPLALEVLVNLCYENLPVLYVLMGKVDLTKFIKCITKLNDDNPMIRMHVCKMLIIFEQIKGHLPDRDILNFLDVIFNTTTEAFQARNYNLLKQIVDFFKDIKESHHFSTVALRYDKSYDDTMKLIQMVDQASGDDQGACLPLVLDFLHSAFFMNYQKSANLMIALLNLAIKNIHNEVASLPCLKILRKIAETETVESCQNGGDTVQVKLSESLPVIASLMDDLEGDSVRMNDKKKQLTTLASLLTVMANNADLRKQVLSIVSCNSIRRVFQDVFKYHSTDHEPVFQPANGELCVKLLSLVSKMANYKADWMSFYTELLSNKHILMELAITFADGDKNVKYEVLRLASNNGWSKDSLLSLCDMMTTLRNTGVVERSPRIVPQSRSPRDVLPLYSRAQDTRLNALLEAMEKAKEDGQLAETATSSVMELFEYKLSAMGQAERRIQAALEASDARCISLNHQLVQLRSEVLRLHELLFSYQLSIEGAKREKNNLIEKQRMLKEQGAAEKAQRTRQANELRNQIQQLEKGLAEKDAEIKTRLNEHELALQKVRGECDTRVSNLGLEMKELQSALAESIKVNQQKDLEIAECNKQIDDLERIREMIVNVAAKREKGGF